MTLCQRHVLLFCLMTAFGCVEPYSPPSIKNAPDYLVVDGFINLTGDSASVKLSHTIPLNATSAPAPEPGSVVTIEDDAGISYALKEQILGTYSAKALSLLANRTYRLHIRTSGGKEYLSRYVALKNTPPIDSVYWTAEENGININIDTHDATGISKYYRWKFVETWEYNSTYFSNYKVVDGSVVRRTEDEYINLCWRTQSSTTILVGTSDRLGGDVIYKFPVQVIDLSSIKLSKRYSVKVEQQVLSAEAYAYWLSLKKSTESLGSLFDPLPSQSNGNLYSTSHPSETVIGYFDGGSIATRRIYINIADIPKELRQYSPPVCPIDTIWLGDLAGTPNTTLILNPLYSDGGGLLGYLSSGPTCADCRVWGGGVTVKPVFWE